MPAVSSLPAVTTAGERKPHAKLAPFPDGALDHYVASVPTSDALGDGQTESGSTAPTGARTLAPIEALEQTAPFLLRKSLARVPDADDSRAVLTFDRDPHASPGLLVLDRVVHEIVEHLPEPP